jgi:hypothetical protein
MWFMPQAHPFPSLLLHPQRLRFAFLLVFINLSGPGIMTAQENGITVGQPKVYDSQSLAIMLDQLNTRLQQISVVDAQSLQKALGLLQGSQQQDVSRSFSVSVTPQPAASASGSSGASAPLPDLLAAPNYKPDYGENPSDLLSDQVDLSYQIFNLRMLLERSLTDRLKDGHPRRQAVVSFNISLDPPRNARDASAYVEITVKAENGLPVALVASMPQEKTYNATALSSSSTAFGGSAVAKIITIGYNQRKRSQTFYLYRDSDTLAIERLASPDATTFGWMFRPVLGRKSVSPGMRQLFAVLALPETDKVDDTTALTLKVTARTYWLHYDQTTATNVVRPGFWDWAAKNVPPSAQLKLQPVDVFPTAHVENWLHPVVYDTQVFQTTSGNTLLQISGENFFPGTTVTVGDKTFTGPQDGLSLKSSQSIVVTASADIFSRSLNAVVNGRYGPSTPLFKPPGHGIAVLKAEVRPKGLKFSLVLLTLGKLDADTTLHLADLQNSPKPILSINGTAVPYSPLLQEITPGPYVLATVMLPSALTQSKDNRVGIIFPLLGQSWYSEVAVYDDSEVQVTKAAGGKSTTLLISRPGLEFNGNWRLILDKLYQVDVKPPVAPVPPPSPSAPRQAANSNSRSAPKKDATPPVEFTRLLPCREQAAEDAAKKVASEAEKEVARAAASKVNGCYMLKIVADTKFLSDYKKFVLVSDDGYAQTLDIPSASGSAETTPPPQPKITSIAPPSVGLNEVVTVTIIGTGLDAIKQVTFEGKPLTFWTGSEKDKTATATSAKPPQAPATKPPEPPDAKAPPAAANQGAPPPPPPTVAEDSGDGKSSQLHVLLTRDVTGKEGHQELLLQVDAKTLITATVTVSPAPTATKSPKTKEGKLP